MGFYDSLVNVGNAIGNLFRPAVRPGEPGLGIAQTQVPYEIATPQYPIPSVYPLAITGYTKNELIYACIQKLMLSVGQAPCKMWDGPIDADDSQVIEDSPVKALLRKPNDFMSEAMFWQSVVMYVNVAGFSVWEKEYNNLHEPIALYPFRPDWCSFRRGPDKLLQYVRYQPAGLPFVDVPIERCIVFMELHPIWNGMRAVSKSAIASRVGSADNAATDFMTTFFQHGAMTQGLLKTTQSLQDAEAERIRKRWKEQHGGVENWNNIAVLGAGADFQATQSSLKEMDFTAIDGRNEARICSVFGVPPMLLGAKVGLSASTYSNYKEARSAFYEETITPLWNHYAGVIENQLVPDFDDSGKTFAGFDLRNVKALQEDRTATWTRANDAFKNSIIARDEARAEMGMDPTDGSDKVFYSDIQALIYEARAGTVTDTTALDQPGDTASEQPKTAPAAPPQQEQAVKALTEWRKAALAAVRTGGVMPLGKAYPELSEALATCKTARDVRAAFEKHWPKAEGKAEITADLGALVSELRAAREALEVAR